MARYDIEDIGFSTEDARIGIVAARFNQHVVDILLQGALTTLEKRGIGDDAITIVRVPGAFEIPLAAQRLAKIPGTDAVIVLGAVIRGETPHFDFVAGECARGVTRVGLDNELPVIFGLLTTDTDEQAQARAGGAHGNKGNEAALAALEMITLLRKLKADG